MKTYIVPRNHSVSSWTASLAAALVLVPSVVFAEGGLVDQSIDAVFNLRDQLQDTVMKSVKGVAEAMQEGPPRDDSRPFTLDDLKALQTKHANLLALNNNLAQQQKQLLDADAKLLPKLPPDHPRRAEIENALKQNGANLANTQKKQEEFRNKLAESNSAIDRWRRANDPTYVPPKVTTAPPAPTAAPAEPPSTEPPKTDNGLDGLKAREAAQEAEARALGREREAAVNKYIDDPTAQNRAEAEAIKQRLVGLVDDLNRVRQQVDGIEGRSRRPIRIRTARQIADHHRRRSSGGGTESHHHGPNGTDVSGSESHHHGPDGTDVSSGSRGGGGKQSTRRTRRTRQPRQSNVVSSENHQHGPGGVDVPNTQVSPQKKNPQKRKRQAQNR